MPNNAQGNRESQLSPLSNSPCSSQRNLTLLVLFPRKSTHHRAGISSSKASAQQQLQWSRPRVQNTSEELNGSASTQSTHRVQTSQLQCQWRKAVAEVWEEAVCHVTPIPNPVLSACRYILWKAKAASDPSPAL